MAKIWDIGGQSNAVGQGALASTWVNNPLFSYYKDGVPTSPNPVGTLHGVELALAAALTPVVGAIAINKSAVNGQSCAALSTTWWVQHQSGINAVKALGTEYNFLFIQGENEAAGTAGPALIASYTSDLQHMISLVRGQFGGTVRVYILQLNVGATPGYTGLASIRTAQANVVAADGNAVLINVDDMGAPALDGTHYTSMQYREIGRRIALAYGATLPVWEKKVLSGATANDVAICNALLVPTVGASGGNGSRIAIPSNWQALIAAGTAVPGCTFARIAVDGTLTVDVFTQAQLATPAVISALSPTLQGYAATLSAKLATL